MLSIKSGFFLLWHLIQSPSLIRDVGERHIAWRLGHSLGKWSGELKPVRSEVHIGFSFLITRTTSLGNTVTENMVAAPFFRV